MRSAASLLLLVFAMSCGASSSTAPVAEPARVDVAAPLPSDEPVYRVLVTPSMPTRGADDALVTIVIFGGFQCPFTARAMATMNEVFAEYRADVRVVFRHLPLPFHDHGMDAAEAAMEAFAQHGDAGFFAYGDILFANREHLEPADLERYAGAMGLDVLRFRSAMALHIHRAAIESDMDAAAASGIRSTPMLFVNGRLVRGAQPFDVFDDAVASALAAARGRIAAGVAAEGVYDDVFRYASAGVVVEERPVARDEPELPDDHVYPIALPLRAPTRGAADAPVVIQIFSDFQCPFCSRVVPTLDEIETRYAGRIRVVWRNYPLPFHDHAMLAHEAAMEAFAQGGSDAFWRMHDLIFLNQLELEQGVDLFVGFASALGLDVPRMRAALSSHAHRAEIEADIAAIGAADVRIGTPSFFINGVLLQGAQPVDAFVAAIDRALGAAPGAAP